MNKKYRKMKANLDLMKFESNENVKLTIERCRMYCKKINECIDFRDGCERMEEKRLEKKLARQSLTMNTT